MIANIMKSFLHGFLCIQYKSQVTAAEIIKDKKHRSHEIIIISEMYLKVTIYHFRKIPTSKGNDTNSLMHGPL